MILELLGIMILELLVRATVTRCHQWSLLLSELIQG